MQQDGRRWWSTLLIEKDYAATMHKGKRDTIILTRIRSRSPSRLNDSTHTMRHFFIKALLSIGFFYCGILGETSAYAQSVRPDFESTMFNKQLEPIVIMIVSDPWSHTFPTNDLIQALKGELASIDIQLTLHHEEQWPKLFAQRIDLAESIATQYRAKAVFWCEYQDSKVYLYLSQSTGGRVLVRRLEHTTIKERNEAVAIIVRSSIEAINNGAVIGLTVEPKNGTTTGSNSEIATPIVSPQNRPSVKNPLYSPVSSFSLGLGYTYMALSHEFSANHGFNVFAAYDFFTHWSVQIGLRIYQSIESTEGDFKITLRQYPLSFALGYYLSFGRGSLGLRAGLDAVFQKHHTISQSPDAQPNEDRVRMGLGVLTMLDLRFNLSRHVGLFFHGGVQIMLKKIDYQILVEDNYQTIINTWRIRPLGMAGIQIVFP